ncbi:MAG: hypothetical protein M3O55_11910 [Actinomycetota bacterium]|nr:hypothetical protein [Actinomycetota bacterium]
MGSRVVVVANASEVQHLSYADPRPLLSQGGIEDVTLLTSSDIRAVRREIDDPSTRAVVLASNSLRDQRLREALSGPLTDSVSGFLGRGGGLLCLHQLRIADAGEQLPSAFFGDEVRLTRRPRTEPARRGRAEVTPDGSRHQAMNFPVPVDLPLLNTRAANSGPGGLYWYSIEPQLQEKWSVLVRDGDRAGQGRPLLVERRFLPAGRVVLCSIPLDWVRSTQMLPNLVQYLRDGPYRIGLLRNPDDDSVTMDEVERTLSRRTDAVYVHRLATPSDASALQWAISAGLHTSVVLASHRHIEELPPQVQEAVNSQVGKGDLRVLEIADASGQGEDFSFSVVSRERDSIDLLRGAVARLRLAILTGLADDSLWATFEGLQAVDGMVDERPFAADHLGAALTDANRREKDGSFDETFVATAALAWLRSRTLGHTDASVRKSVSWLQARRGRQPAVDGVRAAAVLAYADALPPDWRVAAGAALESMTGDTDELYELDVLACLRCALVLDSPTVAPFAVALAARAQDGMWVELAITADCVAALVTALEVGASPAHTESAAIRDATLAGAAYLRSRLAALPDVTAMSSATHARVAAALHRFDEIVGIPVGALVDAAIGSGRQESVSQEVDWYEGAAAAARDTISEYEAELAAMKEKYRAAARLARSYRLVVAAACYLLYLIAALLIGVGTAKQPGLAAAWDQMVRHAELQVPILLAMTAGLANWILRPGKVT